MKGLEFMQQRRPILYVTEEWQFYLVLNNTDLLYLVSMQAAVTVQVFSMESLNWTGKKSVTMIEIVIAI